jgi:2-polyprenyl-6-methoxyphenol hydroxylase-like FAD-dependent oxidoreductase
MKSLKEKTVLVSGASFAGLSTAYWMNKSGYKVTVVEIAKGLKKGGSPVNIEDNTVDIVRRMGLLDQIKSHSIKMELMEFKNADDVTEKAMPLPPAGGDGPAKEEYEIERDILLHIMFEAVKDDVEFIFGDSIAALHEDNNGIDVTFKGGGMRSFDLVFGCDGIHSAVRKYYWGDEAAFLHFLQAYFSITIVNKLLIRENVLQLYNEPGKAVMLLFGSRNPL